VADHIPVWCDVRLCRQAIANLVLNAAQHGPAGGAIEVGVVLEPGAWCLRVRDQGPGWADNGPLGRRDAPPGAPRPAHDGKGGSGLGLAICEVVARLHGGTIGVRHEFGACLEMRFPQPAHPPALASIA
ncbi:MAG: sensor histidine kinase, partial [Hydrogenophaga sp.]|nr:sensor histidine kinase [Hydrogenophaga sp.]